MCWHNMSAIPYLDAFLQLDFVSMNISHFFELLLCLIKLALRTHFKGHMKILASTLRYKSPYPEVTISTASAMAYACKNFNFLLQFCFGKNRTSVKDARQHFLLFSYSVLISLWYNYLFPTHPFKDIHWCLRQMDVWVFGSTHP